MKNKQPGSRYIFGLVVVLALFLALGLWPKGGMIRPDVVQAKITEWMADPAKVGPSFHENHPGIRAAIAVQDRHTRGLMAIPEVVGTAVGLTETGQPAVLVFLKGTPPPGLLLENLEGVPVVAKLTGAFVAMQPPAGKGPGSGGGGGGSIDPTTRFARPVPIGVSTGNIGECSAGTISTRVKSGNTVYALSNNHVYALENSAPKGSEILQPGRYDTSCLIDPNNEIGTLSDFVPLNFDGGQNTVDAAIAATTIAFLGKATPADGYGTPKSQTTVAAVNDAVQKYGRTTKLTKGTITAINATVNVGYSLGTALFVNQIVVYGNKPFIKAGDSGSLLVTDPGRNPVGLLFAGTSSGKYAIANQIGDVLTALGVTIDGE
jgi:hypothetical protein